MTHRTVTSAAFTNACITLGIKEASLSRMLGIGNSTCYGWIKKDTMPAMAALAIRHIVLEAEPLQDKILVKAPGGLELVAGSASVTELFPGIHQITFTGRK